jgi:hypothetical protein
MPLARQVIRLIGSAQLICVKGIQFEINNFISNRENKGQEIRLANNFVIKSGN